jgi:hypothetical protein
MSQMGQSRRLDPLPVTSGLPRTTDINRPAPLVRFVPLTDSCAAANSISYRQFFDRAGASLREFELASALEFQRALPKRERSRSFFGHI